MRLYRADKRDFYVGDNITTANEFASKNPEGSSGIGNLFDSIKPTEKPSRIGCLFLFEDEIVARKHWSKMTDGKLYEVEIDENSILHRADMRLVDKAFSAIDASERELCAKEYWAGIETEYPRIEILVKEATIVSVLSKNQAERREYLLNWPPA